MIVRRQVEMQQTVEVNEETSEPTNLLAIAKAFTNDESWEIVNEKLEVKEVDDQEYYNKHKDDWLKDLK